MSQIRTSSRALLFAFLALLFSCAFSARADSVLATSGPHTLTQGMINDTLAFWQIILGHPMTPADRRAMTAVDVDRFHHDPASLTTLLRGVHAQLPRIRHYDAVNVAALREVNLVDIYCTPQALHLTPTEAAGMQAVAGHYLPVVGVDTPGKMVVTQRDIDAWVAATRFITAQAHVPGPGSGYRANLVRLAQKPATMGPRVESDVADIDRNWAALQLIWPHMPAAQRAQAMAPRLAVVKRAAAQKKNATMAAVEAIDACQAGFQDYLATLGPSLASGRGTAQQQMRLGRFQQNMMNYNLQLLNRGVHNYAGQLSGQDPDMSDPANNIPLPVP